MRGIILVVVLALAESAIAQTPTPAGLTQAEQQQIANAWLSLENAQLRLQLLASEAEKAHPGTHYDFQARGLVMNPPINVPATSATPAPLPPPKAASPKKDGK